MISIFLFVLLIVCIFIIIIIKNNYCKVMQDLNKILIAINRIRYGDINIRLQNLNDKKLESIINRLFETIYDREMMIKEYQATLSKKTFLLKKL